MAQPVLESPPKWALLKTTLLEIRKELEESEHLSPTVLIMTSDEKTQKLVQQAIERIRLAQEDGDDQDQDGDCFRPLMESAWSRFNGWYRKVRDNSAILFSTSANAPEDQSSQMPARKRQRRARGGRTNADISTRKVTE